MRKLGSLAVATAVTFALMLSARPSAAGIDVAVSVNIAPPELPVYEQPEIPGEGYIWTPGYWAWADDGSGYYWVPGTWVLAPQPGYLWTPGWWGWDNSVYLWHAGYWGPEIGFYGGVNYGFGYFGHGYEGGYWDHGQFRYNTVYNHVGGGVHITNVYNKTVVNNVTVNHVSFNGGNGGIQARATPQELTAEHGPHLAPVAAQTHQIELAHGNPALRLSANHGHPAIAATARPGEFSGHGVVASHGAPPLERQPPVNHVPQSRTPPPVAQHSTLPPPHAVTPQPRVPEVARPPESRPPEQLTRPAEAPPANRPAEHPQPQREPERREPERREDPK
jgi:hypothetical protein